MQLVQIYTETKLEIAAQITTKDEKYGLKRDDLYSLFNFNPTPDFVNFYKLYVKQCFPQYRNFETSLEISNDPKEKEFRIKVNLVLKNLRVLSFIKSK